MSCSLIVSRSPLGRRVGLEGKRVQRPAHLTFQRIINHLVLLDPRFAAKCLGDDGGGIVIAVPGKVVDRDQRIGKALLDQPLDVLSRNGHKFASVVRFVRSYSLPMNCGSQRSCAVRKLASESGASPGSFKVSSVTFPITRAGIPACEASCRMRANASRAAATT